MEEITYKAVPDILNLIHKTMPSIYYKARRNLSNEDTWKTRRMWGQRDENQLLWKCCGISVERDLEWLSYFAVLSTYRNNGEGKNMLDFLVGKMKTKTLYVETYLKKGFEDANSFYLSQGFKLCGFFESDTVYYKLEI